MRHISVSPVRSGFRCFFIVVVVLVLSLQAVFAQPANKQQVKRQKAIWNINIAKKQMDRNLYREAEVRLAATISECGSYLTAETSGKLEKMLAAARSSQKGTEQVIEASDDRNLLFARKTTQPEVSESVKSDNIIRFDQNRVDVGQVALSGVADTPVSTSGTLFAVNEQSPTLSSEADKLADILARMERDQAQSKTDNAVGVSSAGANAPSILLGGPATTPVPSNSGSIASQYEALKMQVQALLEQSVAYYNAGDLAKARAGFEEVALSGIDATVNGVTAGGYLDLIEKTHGVRQKGLDAIALGVSQYQQGMYFEAKNTLEVAKAEYSLHLSSEDNRQLESLLAQAGAAVAEREKIAGNLVASSQLKSQGRMLEARGQLEMIKDSAFLSEQERGQIVSAIAELNGASSSVATDYAPVGNSLVRGTIAPPIALQPDMPQDAEESSYVRQVQAQRNRVKSYVAAVVTNSAGQAVEAFGENEFSKAISELTPAFSAIETHKMVLGVEQYQGYKGQLEAIKEQIESGQAKYEDDERIKTAQQNIILAQELKDEVHQQRQQAIANYFEGATAFQLEHKYEEALRQIERILLIEPSNRKALSKQIMLKDTIRWRRILDEEHATNKEEIRLLTTVLEKDRPYANEITFPGATDIDAPRNWKDLTAGRKKDEWGGRAPADYGEHGARMRVNTMSTSGGRREEAVSAHG